MTITKAKWIQKDSTSLEALSNGDLAVKLSPTGLLQKTVDGVGVDTTLVIQPNGSIPFTANQAMGGHKLTNLATPTTSTDAVTKEYVDGKTIAFKRETLTVTTDKIQCSFPPLGGYAGITNWGLVMYRNGTDAIFADTVIDTNDLTGKTFTLTEIISGSWDTRQVSIQYFYQP